MKLSIKLAAGVALALIAMGGAGARAANLIQDGDFSSPSVGGGWGEFSGTGWSNNDPSNPGAIEIGFSPIYGMPCASADVCQNMEVNANAFDASFQTVNGLTVGAQYNLSWLYGGRDSGGPDFLDVSFGGQYLVTNSGSIGVWSPNSYVVTATATSETLVFASWTTSGAPSYGNEITNVSLTAVPEPATWAMMLVGVGALGAALRHSRRRTVQAASA